MINNNPNTEDHVAENEKDGLQSVVINTNHVEDTIESSHNKIPSKNLIHAFIICYYCVCINQFIKKPLAVTKVALHTQLNLTTKQLSHIDGIFLLSRTIGHLIIPSIDELYWRSYLFDCYIIISISLIIIPMTSSFYFYLFFYTVIGFASSNIFPVIMNHIVTWLPKKFFVKLLLFWVTSQNIGSFIGIGISTIAIRLFGWRSCYIVISFFVCIAASIIRNVYVDPHSISKHDKQNTSDIELQPVHTNKHTDPETKDKVIIDYNKHGIFDRTYTFFTNLLKPIFGYRTTNHESNEINVSTIWKRSIDNFILMFKNFYVYLLENKDYFISYAKQLYTHYESIFVTCPRIILLFITYFFMDLINYSYAFWLPFYLTTQLGYGSEVASDISMALYVGGVFGIILASVTTDLFPQDHRIGVTGIWCIGLFLSILLFQYCITFGTIPIIICTALVGITSNATGCMISTISIYDIFKKSGLDDSMLLTTSNINLSFGSAGAVIQSYLTISLSNKHGWDSVFYTFSGMSFVSFILMSILYYLDNRRPTNNIPN